jgi:hypothetical protein
MLHQQQLNKKWMKDGWRRYNGGYLIVFFLEKKKVPGGDNFKIH